MDKKLQNGGRVDRRVALQWISSASVSLPFLSTQMVGAEAEGAAAPSGSGYGPDPDLLTTYQPGDLWPLTLSQKQRDLMIVLCDIIVPADESSPSASSLGVHDFVDEWISAPYPTQEKDRKLLLKGLTWLEEEAGRRESSSFVSLGEEAKLEICQELAVAARKNRREFPGSFFLRLRDLVAGGYYTTPVGMKDLGYRGNMAMAEWNGPPAEVLEKLGLSPQ